MWRSQREELRGSAPRRLLAPASLTRSDTLLFLCFVATYKPLYSDFAKHREIATCSIISHSDNHWLKIKYSVTVIAVETFVFSKMWPTCLQPWRKHRMAYPSVGPRAQIRCSLGAVVTSLNSSQLYCYGKSLSEK